MKSSDIQLGKCHMNSEIKNIKVHVVDTFFVDGNLSLKGINEMGIFAYKWNILQTAVFDLSGIDGEEHLSLPKFSGLPGKPGNVGKNGANFLGTAYDSVNLELLTVNLNGGHGGNGQDGSGNNDVYVGFNYTDHHDKGERLPTTDEYYRRFFRNKGYDAELISSTSRKEGFEILSTTTRTTQRFQLNSRSCCGKTGMGGEGNLKIQKDKTKKYSNRYFFQRWVRWP